jgi:PAS domain S-box-containing protein
MCEVFENMWRFCGGSWLILSALWCIPLSAEPPHKPSAPISCLVLGSLPNRLSEGQAISCVGILTTRPRHALTGTIAVLQYGAAGLLLVDDHSSRGLAALKRGDRARILGTVKPLGDTLGVEINELESLGAATEPAASDILIRELREGQHSFALVRVSGELVSSKRDNTIRLRLRDRSGEVPFRLGPFILGDGALLDRLSRGGVVEVVGLVEYHEGENGQVIPFLRPRDGADFRFAPKPPYAAMFVGAGLFSMCCVGLYLIMRVRAMHRHSVALTKLTESLRQSEAALKVNEQLYRSVTETATDAILTIDDKNQILFANKATQAIFGWTTQELLGQGLGVLIPDDCRAAACGGERIEALGKHKDGHTIAAEVSISKPSEDSRHARTTVLRDVTERKQAEDEIRRRNQALRELSRQLLRSQDDERRRIARELHDGTNQNLAALKINLSLLQDTDAIQDAKSRRIIAEALALTDQSSREIRSLSYLLHPPMLDELGLDSALQSYVEGFCQRTGIEVALRSPARIGRLTQDTETTVFRIVQEALGNIHRHSGSKRANISLERVGNEIRLEISDEGKGGVVMAPMAPGRIKMGVGLLGMRERAQQLGGSLEVVSSSSGTAIFVRLPVEQKGTPDPAWRRASYERNAANPQAEHASATV